MRTIPILECRSAKRRGATLKFILALPVCFYVSLSTHAQPTKRSAQPEPKKFVKVEQITSTYLVYSEYEPTGPYTIDLSDLVLSETLTKPNTPIPQFLDGTWGQDTDFKRLLLERGMAKLRSLDTAVDSYKNAQKSAEAAKLGMWKTASVSPTPVTSQTRSEEGPDWSRIGSLILRWAALLSPLGVGGLIVGVVSRKLYKKLYIQRRISLLIIGEPSVGKTALYLRLLDPKTSRADILKLEHTGGLQKIKKQQFIPKGKFEIYPALTDVPGSNYGTAWDEISGVNKHALLLVLAPTDRKEQNGNWNDKYIYTQLGYVRAFIEGGLGSNRTRKPHVLILFINKFDLMSQRHPDDSVSMEANKELHRIFADHIQSATFAAKKAKIKLHVIVGSALENWNCERIIEVTGQELYGI